MRAIRRSGKALKRKEKEKVTVNSTLQEKRKSAATQKKRKNQRRGGGGKGRKPIKPPQFQSHAEEGKKKGRWNASS